MGETRQRSVHEVFLYGMKMTLFPLNRTLLFLLTMYKNSSTIGYSP